MPAIFAHAALAVALLAALAAGLLAALAGLEPHFPTFTEIYKSAVDLYNEGTSPRIRAEHTSRAALNSIYALVWKGYEREFGEVSGLHLLNMRNPSVSAAGVRGLEGFFGRGALFLR